MVDPALKFYSRKARARDHKYHKTMFSKGNGRQNHTTEIYLDAEDSTQKYCSCSPQEASKNRMEEN